MSFWHPPTWDEILIILAGVVAFLVVTFAFGGDESEAIEDPEPPVATATPTATPPPTPPPTPTSTATPEPTAAPTQASAPNNPDDCDYGEHAERVRAAVVEVRAEFPTEIRGGTAFHIGEGLYVTAAHVIQDGSGVTASSITLYDEGRGLSVISVEKAGSFSTTETRRDLALLRAEPIAAVLETRTPTEDDMARNIAVRVLGYPWSSVGDTTTGSTPLQTAKGNISSVGISDGIHIVQFAAPVDGGMSGGPLVNECGDALAVVSYYREPDDIGDPPNFFVSISISEIDNLD